MQFFEMQQFPADYSCMKNNPTSLATFYTNWNGDSGLMIDYTTIIQAMYTVDQEYGIINGTFNFDSGTKGSTGNYGYCRVSEFTSDISDCNGNWYLSSSLFWYIWFNTSTNWFNNNINW